MLLFAFFMLAAVAMLAECFRELHGFQITHYQINSPVLSRLERNLRIIFLSDLHNYCYGKENQVLYRAIEEERPDLILVGGDMLIGKQGEHDVHALELLRRLPEVCPVYMANGNHEQRMKEHPEKYGKVFFQYREALQRSGVHFLENASVLLEKYGLPMQLHGLELPLDYYEKFKRRPVPTETVERCIGQAAKDHYQILLAHNPGFFDTYKKWGADLVLSGHLHGGIVRIPGVGGCITPQALLFPKYSGEMTKEGDSTIIVSRGLGTHTVNIRLFNTAEVVVIDLPSSRNDTLTGEEE